MKKRALIVTLCIILSDTILAQGLITTREGLCSSNLNSLLIDSNGNLWIGTENGLNEFDGFTFTSFYSNPKNSNSPINDEIHTLIEDQDKNILIGTLGGLCKYSLDNHEFKNIHFENRERPNISSIIKRRDGSILAGTRGFGGLYEIVKDGDGEYLAKVKEWKDKPDNTIIIAIYEDKSDNLWVWVSGDGVYAVTPEGRTTKMLETPDDNEQFGYASFCEDSYDSMYIAGWKTGLLVRKDGENGLQQIRPDFFKDLRITGLRFRSGLLYISTYGDGIFTYDVDNGRIASLQLTQGSEPLESPQVNDFIFDKEGNIIAGIVHNGLLIKSMKSDQMFHTTNDGNNKYEYDSKSPVLCMSVNKDNHIWIGTRNDGIFLIDRKMNVIEHILTGSDVSSIFEDRNGDLWYGARGFGLFRIAKGTSAPVQFPLKDSNGKNMYNVSEILEDNVGNLWICCTGYGVVSINPDRSATKVLPTGEGMPYSEHQSGNILENKWANCAKLISGKIYIGTYNGLSCYNPRTDSFLSEFTGRNHILTARIINDMELDANNDLWLATKSGLVHLNHETWESERYNYSDGLPQNNINSVMEDKYKRIWVSTSNGLSYLDKETGQFTNILMPRGANNEFCIKSSAVLEDGTMLFGNQNGITWFNPSDVTYSTNKSSIVISDIYSNGEHILSEALKGNNIYLKHKQNSFSLAFSTGAFSNNRQATFSYKLDDDRTEHLPLWSNKVTFSMLDAGKYTMKVFCNSPENTYEDLDLCIIVRQSWYASVFAEICYLLLLAMAVAYLFSKQKREYDKQQLIQKGKHELEMNEAKLRFFFNLAHEIRMPMSLIISPLSKLIETDKDPGRQVQYSLMANNARRISLLINQIMDIRKIEKGKMSLTFSKTDINAYVKPLVDIMEQNAKMKGITLSFTPAAGDPEVWIDVNQFDKIVLNLLQNAIKFTQEGGIVELSMSSQRNNLTISVKDSGIGIDEDKLDRIFDRFYQANSNGSNFGFGIGLNLVQSLVQMHHGTVTACNNVNTSGALFEVSIPLGRGHLSDSEISDGGIALKPASSNLELYESAQRLPYSEESKTSKQKDSIAVVEDNAEIRKYLEKELSDDFNVTVYCDGSEAYKGILKNAPDAIISDIVMPNMDGYQLCNKLKRNINTNAIPIILLTGKTEETDKMNAMDAGADAYITKPFNIILLKKNIRQLIDNVNRLKNIYIGRQNTVIENVPDIKSADESLMSRITKVLNNNISNPELNVDFLAREAGLSRVHLYRKLMELTNQSPGEFIRNSRLKMAAEMLSEKHIDISTAATECGFSSVSVFSRAFKQLYGVSPSEYSSK